jgi:outer membrane immunogenic protein
VQQRRNVKTTLRNLTAFLLTLPSVPALAADSAPLPYAPAQAFDAYDWTGGYFGVSTGYQWGKVTNNGARPSGAVGGGQAGYSWQAGRFVIGGETDLQVSGADDTFAPWQFSNPWFGTLRGRAGFAMNNVVFYGTAGLAYGGLKAQLAGARESKTQSGWTAGAGVEVALARKWSAKAEYLFMDLADRGYVLTGVPNGLESNMLRLGVNYRF